MCPLCGIGEISGTTYCVQVKDSESEILTSLDVIETPALVVLTPDGETVKYDGETLSTKCQLCLNEDAEAATLTSGSQEQPMVSEGHIVQIRVQHMQELKRDRPFCQQQIAKISGYAMGQGECCCTAGAMKAKELTSFLKRYALDSPAQQPDASKQESGQKPDTEAEDSDDSKEKAVPQVSLGVPTLNSSILQICRKSAESHRGWLVCSCRLLLLSIICTMTRFEGTQQKPV